MEDLARAVSEVATASGFSGVVRVDRAGRTEFAGAFGLAEREFGIPNMLDTQFGIASAVKPFTALVVVSLIQEGGLAFDTPVRDLLEGDLPLVDDAATIEHMLSHRSGIGDYVDEDDNLDDNDYLMPVPVHQLASTESYLSVLEGHEQKFAPGERFSYCNSGYVVLALLAERVSGRDFPDLVKQRVCEPADMTDTAFPRSDELPGRAARGTSPTRGCARTCCTYRCGGAVTAASTRPSPTCMPSGMRSWPAGSSPRTGSPKGHGRAAMCPRSPSATDSVCG